MGLDFDASQASRRRPALGRYGVAALAAALGWAAAQAAWVSEDAYIIFRTVDNFLHGYGLRWNVAERVQSFTAPLWTLALAAAGAVTREYYFTALALGLACSAAAVWILARKLCRSLGAAAWLLSALCSSKAFVDFTTSGLENALGYLLLAAFGLAFLGQAEGERQEAGGGEVDQGSVFRRAPAGRSASSVPAAEAGRPATDLCHWFFRMALIAALGVCNRLDMALLFAPAAAYAFWMAARAAGWRRVAGAALLAGLPLLAWELFSLLYYGFPVPNTAYAKLHTGIPARKLIWRGLLYLLDSLERDPATLGTLAAALLLAAACGDARRRALGLGVAAYLAYTVRVGGDFMSGRFLTLPFFAACVAAAGLPLRRLWLAALIPGALLLGLRAEKPTLTYGGRYENRHRPRYIADERGYYYPWSGLWPVVRNGGRPRGPWVEEGARLRASGARVAVRESIGYLGYFAGPSVHLVDRLALCDPLLARMEVPDKNHWRIGHFARRVPAGYVETLESGENRIQNPRLRELYEVLKVLTRDPVWSWRRLGEILKINLGGYERLMREA